MGNRNGSPPKRYNNDTDDEQGETEETHQTGIEDISESGSDEESSDDNPDVADDSKEQHEGGGGGGGGGGIHVPAETEPETKPAENEESDEVVDEDSHPDTEEELEPESEEQDDAEDDEFEFVYGDIVYDRDEDPAEDEAPENRVVVNLPDEEIVEWECSDGDTLADHNPGYPPTDSVVVTVKLETIEDVIPEWDERDDEIALETLEDSLEYRCYPSLRLELEEPSHLRTS